MTTAPQRYGPIPAAGHSIPPELKRWPRNARCRSWRVKARHWIARLLVLPHTLIGLYLAWWVVLLVSLAVAGHDIPGRVVRAWATQGKGTVSYQVAYRYEDEGARRSKTATVSEERYRALEKALDAPRTTDGPEEPTPRADAGAAVTVRIVHLGPIRPTELVGGLVFG